MLVLGLDLETTGLDVGKDQIIEVGAVVWDWTRAKPLKIYNQLVKIDTELDPVITKITGIESTDLERWGEPLEKVLGDLYNLAQEVEYLVAHNGNQFDRLILERVWAQHPQTKISLEWIDTMCDVPYPESMTTRKLSYLAAEHGFLNPFAHRASFDVLTMLSILSRYQPDVVMSLQSSPMRRVVAKVSYDNRDHAKTEGFRWDPNQKHWYMEAKECVLEVRNFPFPVVWL